MLKKGFAWAHKFSITGHYGEVPSNCAQKWYICHFARCDCLSTDEGLAL